MDDFEFPFGGGPMTVPDTATEAKPLINVAPPPTEDMTSGAGDQFHRSQTGFDYDIDGCGHSHIQTKNKQTWSSGSSNLTCSAPQRGITNSSTNHSTPCTNSNLFGNSAGYFSPHWDSSMMGASALVDSDAFHQSIEPFPSGNIVFPQDLQDQCAAANIKSTFEELPHSNNSNDHISQSQQGFLPCLDPAIYRSFETYPTPPPSRSSGYVRPYGRLAVPNQSLDAENAAYYFMNHEGEDTSHIPNHYAIRAPACSSMTTCAWPPDACVPAMLEAWDDAYATSTWTSAETKNEQDPAQETSRTMERQGKKGKGASRRYSVQKIKNTGRKPDPPLPKGADLHKLLAIAEFAGQKPQVTKAELARRHNTSANNVLQNAKNSVKAWAGSPEKFKRSWQLSKKKLATMQHRAAH